MFQRLTGTYCGPPPDPGGLWAGWNGDPALLAALAAAAVLLRGSRPGLIGVGALVLAFVSPLCALSAALFAARAVHHVLLVAVAAPLLAVAVPGRRPQGGASLWLAASIGLAVGLGLWLKAVVVTVLALFIVRALGRMEHAMKSRE